jgi:hypothetical protein
MNLLVDRSLIEVVDHSISRRMALTRRSKISPQFGLRVGGEDDVTVGLPHVGRYVHVITNVAVEVQFLDVRVRKCLVDAVDRLDPTCLFGEEQVEPGRPGELGRKVRLLAKRGVQQRFDHIDTGAELHRLINRATAKSSRGLQNHGLGAFPNAELGVRGADADAQRLVRRGRDLLRPGHSFRVERGRRDVVDLFEVRAVHWQRLVVDRDDVRLSVDDHRLDADLRAGHV